VAQVPQPASSTGQPRQEANHVADQIERVRSVDGGLITAAITPVAVGPLTLCRN
jgi:hypothetical protein